MDSRKLPFLTEIRVTLPEEALKFLSQYPAFAKGPLELTTVLSLAQ